MKVYILGKDQKGADGVRRSIMAMFPRPVPVSTAGIKSFLGEPPGNILFLADGWADNPNAQAVISAAEQSGAWIIRSEGEG